MKSDKSRTRSKRVSSSSESDTESSYESEVQSQSETSEDEDDRIQSIVGIKALPEFEDDSTELSDLPSEKIRYLVKWVNRSHVHDSLLSEGEVVDTLGGEQALKKFRSRSQDGLSRSHSNADIMTVYQEDLNDGWTKVDRLLGEASDGDWLVKWRNLTYEESTWETPDDIPDFEDCVKAYRNRRKHTNPKKIPADKPRPTGGFVPLKTSPRLEDGSELRDYQLSGVNWLLFSWYEHRNSILADEMGLGKTVQIVMTLTQISQLTGITGPFLVISPLSTLQQWRREFEKWSDLNPVVFHGKPASREVIINFEFSTDDEDDARVGFDVLITNYETFANEFETFKGIEWRYIVLDEGHRLKNHEGKCYKLLQTLKYEHCTLLTGTPIQNNVEELWSLLHLLHPEEFDNLEEFLEKFGHIEDVSTLQSLQEIIRPYILRRKKNDVEDTLTALEETIIEVELTRIQKMYYTTFLHENAGVLMQQITGGSLPSLQNLMMQLRKVCNHPFLIKGASEHITSMMKEKMDKEASEDDVALQSIVQSSGKMILVDKLLPKLRKDHHKVLIFSQMVKVLDIIEDYLAYRDIQWERIDGNIPEPERNAAIERFAKDDDAFVFLLCTRAGGVGINLTAADTVIIYDSDWNPQNDVQAQSRCHRIGQTQDVKVYRLVTRGTYELEMLDRASRKLGLEQALLDGGEINKSEPVQASEIEKLLRYGAYNILHQDDSETDKFCSQDIDQILDSRTRDRTRETFGSSVFSKAVFDNGLDDKEADSADFWASILPEGGEQVLDERRCKKKKHLYYDTSSDLDSDSETEGETGTVEKTQRKRNAPVSIRRTIRKLVHFGVGENEYERAIFYHAAIECLTLKDEDIAVACEMLGIPSLEAPSEDIVTTLNTFNSNLNDVHERCQSIVRRCITFYKLTPIMMKLQGPVERWPASNSCDPINDYAFLLGIFRNGIGETESVTEGIEYKEIKIPSLKTIEKRISWLIPELEKILADVPIPDLGEPPEKPEELVVRNEFRGDEMQPEEWCKAHENLFNRKELTTDENIAMFQTIHSFGVTKDESGEWEWDKIAKLAKISGVASDSIKEAGELILELGKLTRNGEDFETEIAKTNGRFLQYGTKLWFKKMYTAVQELDSIRTFMKTFSKSDESLLLKVKKFNAADWWTVEHDVALLKSLAEYGQLFVTTWIVKEDLPFRKLIPDNLIDDFEKCADLEQQRTKQYKPHDCGPFAFLFKDKLRITRAMNIVKTVENIKERARITELHLTNAKKHTNPISSSSICIIPNKFYVNCFGIFSSSTATYPSGYSAKVLFYSVTNPAQQQWYEENTIVDANGNITFVVKMLADAFPQFIGNTPDECWEQIFSIIKSNGVQFDEASGDTMFGFNQPRVADMFMKGRARLYASYGSIPMPIVGQQQTKFQPQGRPISMPIIVNKYAKQAPMPIPIFTIPQSTKQAYYRVQMPQVITLPLIQPKPIPIRIQSDPTVCPLPTNVTPQQTSAPKLIIPTIPIMPKPVITTTVQPTPEAEDSKASDSHKVTTIPTPQIVIRSPIVKKIIASK